jgi:hypothetical protein
LFEQLNAGIWIGLVVQLLGRLLPKLSGGVAVGDYVPPIFYIGYGVSFLGVLIFVWGCMRICANKGYSAWLGLLGLLSCLGLLVVLILPEKS